MLCLPQLVDRLIRKPRSFTDSMIIHADSISQTY